MHHFFVTPNQVSGDEIYIEGSDVNHICNVLRMKKGEKLQISDGNNKKYLCQIDEMTAEKVFLHIVEEQTGDTELPSKIYLFQGLPKSDKMELIVQKAVELGVYEIIPVATKTCGSKVRREKSGKESGAVEQYCRRRCEAVRTHVNTTGA